MTPETEELLKEAEKKIKKQNDYEACLAMFPSGVGEMMCSAMRNNTGMKKPVKPALKALRSVLK